MKSGGRGITVHIHSAETKGFIQTVTISDLHVTSNSHYQQYKQPESGSLDGK